MNLETTESKKTVANPGEGQHYSNMMSEVNASRHDGAPRISLDNYFRNSLTPRPNIRNEWAQTELDFGNSQDLYGRSKDNVHPFTPQEIAGAGANEAVMLNDYQAVSKGPYASVAGDANAPQTRNGFGLVNPGYPLAIMTGQDSPRQIYDNVAANWAQSGSAGVDQGGLPDCTFEATLASLASTSTGRKDISNMITKNKNGSYEVTFPGEPNKPVDITSKDLNDPRIQDSAGWAKILEAANLKVHPEAAEPDKSTSAEAIHLLTGSQSQKFFADHEPKTAAGVAFEEQWLHSRLSQGEIVVAENAPLHNPVIDHHVYSVLSEANGEVTVRNPWGDQVANAIYRPSEGSTANGVTNLGGGILEMPIRTFNRDFGDVQASKPYNSQSS